MWFRVGSTRKRRSLLGREIENLLLDGKPVTEPLAVQKFNLAKMRVVGDAARQFWRRMFLSQMEGKRMGSLSARRKVHN
jgi:hypothetical protein